MDRGELRRWLGRGGALWLLFCALLAQAAEPVALGRDSGFRIDLHAGLSLLRDPGHALDPAQAWQALAEGRFRPVQESASYGFSHDAFWFALRVENRDHPARRWLLTVEQPRLDRIDLWWRDAAGASHTARLGDALPFAERSEPHRFPNTALDLGAGEAVDILLRVESSSSIQLPLALYTPNELYRASYDGQAGAGLYYGLLLALLLYNLAVLLSIRDPTYLYYVAYVAAFGLLMLSFNGVGFQYLWPDSPEWQNTSLPFSIGAVLCTTVMFAASFLDLNQHLPALARALRYSVAVFAALIAFAFTRWRYDITIVFNLGVIALGLVVTAAAVICARRGYRPAWYYLIAWTLLIGGGIALPLSSFGVIPRTVLTEYSVQFGSAAEMLLLSFSLAYRIHLLRDANERLATEARELLEQRVSERTLELAATAQRLEQANRQLRESSLRDGLTGAYNRRYLDQSLDAIWQAAQAGSPLFSLLMIDIDHFKAINDNHGHTAGDDCLRTVAQRLRDACEVPGGFVARYGGEEFMAVLPGLGTHEAATMGQRLRLAVSASPVPIEGAALTVTVSIGVASFDARHTGSLAELLRLTDQALYRAKRSGRDRVVAAVD
ncbi:sensor domain-containing diguanylate cyclase [Tahibacter harae]|uniref:diguanylate cyclase n=1 Tax=Tahibacter harae TaxID=2963937 RepID=A0ABT1QUM5_9GAMM|nr:7TM diverse intracellular signaling domain-containing protein [Tahibacter harae]MCQ4165988.1 diguanylate cyclase [Tahibacter harae]